MTKGEGASTLQLLGACGFGALIGWLVYYTNRYRRGEVQFSDLVTLVGVIGGGAVLTLFPANGRRIPPSGQYVIPEGMEQEKRPAMEPRGKQPIET
jgi:hypothetical protein